MKIIYQKDKLNYSNNGIATVNFSEVFGTITQTTVDLINSCRLIHEDKFGRYRSQACGFDESGNVYFEKSYLNY